MPCDTSPFSKFTNLVTSEQELRRISGHPLPQITAKEVSSLDQMCRDFIATSPFALSLRPTRMGILMFHPVVTRPALFRCCPIP